MKEVTICEKYFSTFICYCAISFTVEAQPALKFAHFLYDKLSRSDVSKLTPMI